MSVPEDDGRLADRPFFERDVLQVARDLLGAVVEHADAGDDHLLQGAHPGEPPGEYPHEHGLVAVRLTEVEAYAGPDDPGSHAARGLTPRTAVMFGPAGHAYVYFSYGMHWCANLVTGEAGHAAAVLLRAGEVVAGLPLARARRPSARRDRDLARGPARLAAALSLSGHQHGADVCAPGAPLRVRLGPAPSVEGVQQGPRVGVSGPGGDGAAHPWRFWLAGEPTVSPYRAAAPRQPAQPRPAQRRPAPRRPDQGRPAG